MSDRDSNGGTPEVTGGRRLADAARARVGEVVAALRAEPPAVLHEPSRLPGWTRLHIVCHLRYVATALQQMTAETVAGRPAAMYPEGRAAQRPGTLVPGPGEGPADVVTSLSAESTRLHDDQAALSPDEWALTIREPDDNPDLGPVSLAQLALSWLTEVEVHGTDLGLGLEHWGEVFVTAALTARLTRLAVRRTNHREFDHTVQGTWLLVATDGPCVRLAVEGVRVTSETADRADAADAVIEGTARDLLALLLGRPPLAPLVRRGDLRLADAFGRAFPGP